MGSLHVLENIGPYRGIWFSHANRADVFKKNVMSSVKRPTKAASAFHQQSNLDSRKLRFEPASVNGEDAISAKIDN